VQYIVQEGRFIVSQGNEILSCIYSDWRFAWCKAGGAGEYKGTFKLVSRIQDKQGKEGSRVIKFK
jgi:hypothetical protein